MQVLGGYGYSKEFPVERMHRDALAWRVAGGTAHFCAGIFPLQGVWRMAVDEYFRTVGCQQVPAAPSGGNSDPPPGMAYPMDQLLKRRVV
jgi:hypothetical protein